MHQMFLQGRVALSQWGACDGPRWALAEPLHLLCSQQSLLGRQCAWWGLVGLWPQVALAVATTPVPCPQCLYVCLPALLECPPFQTEPRDSHGPAPVLPEELRRVVAVYQAALDLLRQLQVHPEVASQMLAYLFFFSGALLLNQILERGERCAQPLAPRQLPPQPMAQGHALSSGRGGLEVPPDVASLHPAWPPAAMLAASSQGVCCGQ